MAEPLDPWEARLEGELEYFTIEPGGRLTRHHDDARAARTHAVATGGRLLRGRTEVVWATLEDIPLNVDDAY
ncbi:MAG: hypothetical protein EOL89_04600 [Actinobacteria bacterium]|nr:hypothetical protein [Actinomycetota bacterium]